MRTAPQFAARLAAARGLLPRRRDVAVATMIEDWRLRRAGGGPQPEIDGCGLPVEEVSPLIEALVESDAPEAIRALGEDLVTPAPGVRIDVLGTLARATGLDWTWAGHPAGGATLSNPAALSEVDTIFAALVQDRSVVEVQVNSETDGPGAGITVRDVAAAALARRAGTAGPTLRSTFVARERAVANLASSWHAHARTPVPVPPLPTIATLPDAEVHPVLDAWVASSGPDPATWAEVRALEARGLPALAPMEAWLRRGVPGPRGDELRAVTGRMAFLVREVVVDPASVEVGADVPTPLRARLDALPSSILTARAIIDLVTAAMETGPRAAASASLTFERPGDSSGVEVVVRIGEAVESPGREWSAALVVVRGRTAVVSARGRHWSDATDVLTSLRDALDEALAAAPDERILVHVALQRRP